MKDNNKKIMVTGAGGYIGSIATYLLLENGYEVVALDNFSTGYRQPLEVLQKKFGKDKLRFYSKDLKENLSDVFKQEKNIDALIHYAALCLVNESMEYPQKYFSNNVCGTQNLLTYILKNDVQNVVFSSTSEVYGEAEYMPIDEEHPLKPVNPYGDSKRIIERVIQWYGELKDINYVIFRYFNVCGASDDGLIGDSKKPSQLLVQNAVRGAMDIEHFYLTYNEADTPDGSPIRDYIDVVDLNRAHIIALEYLVGGGESEEINLGTGTGFSVLEVVDTVQEVTGKKFDIKKGKARKGEPDKKIAKIDKAKKVLGWEPERTIADSINSLIKWYKDHPDGWDY